MPVFDMIATKGFYHRKKFLNKKEIKSLKKFCDGLAMASNSNYPSKFIPDCSVLEKSVLKKIDALQKSCFPNEELMLVGAVVFTVSKDEPEKSINLDFHQDYDSFFEYGTHTHYLNFWVVLEKEDIENSNLTIVPFDALREASPKVFEMLRGSGATSISGDRLIKDDLDSEFKLDIDFDAISITPKMDSGDLLLLRGDMVHKTQNQYSNRISISFRAIKKTTVINRRQFFCPSIHQIRVMRNNFQMYAFLDYLFSEKKSIFLTAEEMEKMKMEYLSKTKRGEIPEEMERFENHKILFEKHLDFMQHLITTAYEKIKSEGNFT